MFVRTVPQFVEDSYQLISANSPTVPIPNGDMSKGIQFLNQLVMYYSGTGLLTTIAKQINFIMAINSQYAIFSDPAYQPPPLPPVVGAQYTTVQQGRLSDLQNAWLTLDGVTYPLIDESRNIFFDSYKFDPQEGLPRFCIITNNIDYTTMRVYPSPSQQYTVSVYGKFQLPIFTSSMTMAGIPQYNYRFLQIALAKDLAIYKGRASAWTSVLEQMYQDAKMEMESVSPINLAIRSDHDSLLNGSWRVRAGI